MGKKGRSQEVSRKSEVGSPKPEDEKPSAANRPAPTDSTELQTANSQLQTEQMEVHHHPDLHHEKKPWKEYLLEFLMIFLAVTMGFFAETIREGVSDSAKGKEYIRSFVDDLRTDTAKFSNLLAFDNNKTGALNDIFACYDSVKNNGTSAPCLVPIVKNSVYNRIMNFADGTIQQLKNAGGFRLLNKSDKDSIVAYDNSVHIYQNFESTLFQERQNVVREIYVKLFNVKVDTVLVPNSRIRYAGTPLMFTNDKALLNEYFNDLVLYKRVNGNQINQITKLKKHAVWLIKYFENKYELGNE